MPDTTTAAARIVERWQRLKSDRAVHESVWQELADYIRPMRGEFSGALSPGAKRHQKVFDSTPLIAADNFAGGLYGMMTNPANRWFSLRLADEELNEWGPVRDWLYDVETRLLNSFGPQISRFYNVVPSLYADLAVFGTAVFYCEEQLGQRRINDAARALAEVCIAENAWGDVDTVYRRFTLEARNASALFGDKLSPAARRRAEKDPAHRLSFIHAVEPEEDDAQHAFRSIYVEEEARHEVSRGGYFELPYQVPRWTQSAGETYGRGLGETVLADVKMLNRMDETAIRAAQKIADPPLAATDEGVIRAARTYPGGITYGAIDSNGNTLLRPLYTGGNPRLTLEMMEQRRQHIREGFYFSLMQMVGAPNMTATEWLGRQEEKLRLMGPNLGRIQSEFLSPLIRRRFGILNRAGQLPPPPWEAEGQAMNVEYVSPLARAQMASEAQAIVRLYQSVGPIAQADLTVLDNLDHDQAVQTLGRGWAVPSRVLRGRDEVHDIRARRLARSVDLAARS